MIETAPTCDVSDPHTNAGSYTIRCSGGIDDKYDFTYLDGTLTVDQVKATVVADAKSKYYGDANPALTATVTGTVNGETLNYTLATTATTASGVGGYPITVTLGSNPNYSVIPTDGTLTINQRPATVVADAKSKIYGEDNPALTATVVGQVAGGDLINYTLSTTAVKLSGVGNYPIAVTLGSNPNYGVSKTDGTLTVLQAGATATYTSFGWYSTKSPTDKSFSILLSATVVGTTPDIRTATVTFHEGSTVLCSASVGLVDPTNLKVGAASCYWNGTLSNGAEEHDVTVVVGGNYTAPSVPTPVTISQASITNFITGGGYLVLTNSSGTQPGELNSKLNLGFTVKYNKSGTNPQGKVTAILRAADGHHYQIKSTAIDSLSVQPINTTRKISGTGVFTAKCNITDLATGLSVPGQYTIKLYVEDNGEPGGPKWNEDQLYLVVFNSAGGIWFSSNWTNNQTAVQPIMNGNLQVH